MSTPAYPSIAVIVAMHNASTSIIRALRSIAHQSVAPKQIIVIDDASSDNSRELVKAFISETGLSVVELIELEKNVGAGAARNHGLERVRSDWYCFLDSDDEFDPRFVESAFNELHHSDDVDILIGDHTIVQLNKVERERGPKVGPGRYESRFALADFLADKYTPYLWDKVYRAETLAGIRLPELQQAEDAAFNVRAFAHSRKVQVAKISTIKYHVTSSSLTWSAELSVDDTQKLERTIRADIAGFWNDESIRRAYVFSSVLSYLNSTNIVARKYEGATRRDKIRERTRNYTWADAWSTLRISKLIGLSAVVAKAVPGLYARAYGVYAGRLYSIKN